MLRPGRLAVVAAISVVSCAGAWADDYSRFVELRVYTAREGHRHRFLDSFEQHYVQSPEVIWLRGDCSMDERKDGLERFHTPPASPLDGRRRPPLR